MEEAEKLGVDIKDFSINIDDVDYIVYDLVFYKERWKKLPSILKLLEKNIH